MNRVISRRLDLESLEERLVPTAYVFVDFGDLFPLVGATQELATTVGAFRDVAVASGSDNAIQGPQLFNAAGANYADATAFRMINFGFSVDERAMVMDLVRRAFAPLDISVVELTATPQALADGRIVVGAASMADVTATLRGNSTTSSDSYIFSVTPAIGPTNDNPNFFATNGYGGIAPGGTVLGEPTDLQAGANTHDDVAIGFTINNLNFVANTIVHEAGHALGLQHALTNAAPATTPVNNEIHHSEVMSYLSNVSTSFMFTHFPLVRGDDNSPSTFPPPGGTFDNNDLEARNAAGDRTPFNQMRLDPGIGENPGLHYISGTGSHDIITVTKDAGATATVTVQAFTDATYTVPIIVPGTAVTTFSYTVNLDRSLLIYAGLGDDQIILDGALGVAVTIHGMDGTDSLVINAGNAANATYTPGSSELVGPDLVGNVRTNSYQGTLTYDTTSVSFVGFELTSTLALSNALNLTFIGTAGQDVITLSNPTGTQIVASGTVNTGVDFVSLTVTGGVTNFNQALGDSNDTLTIQSDLTATGVTIGADLGAGTDTLLLSSLAVAQSTVLTVLGATDGFGGTTNSLNGTFTNVDVLVGTAATDTLTGLNDIAIWNLTATDPRTYLSGGRSLSYSAYENIVGGSGDDTFAFQPNGTVPGTLDGGGGNDTLNYSAYHTGSHTNLQTQTSTGITGTFSNIVALVGSAFVDSLTAVNDFNIWAITQQDAGNVDGFRFSAVEVLNGGSNTDIYQFSATGTFSGTINAGVGNDSIAELGARNNDWIISGNDSGSITFLGAFTGVENLFGGAGIDQYFFQNSGTLSGGLRGGGGVDWIADQSARANNWFVVTANAGGTTFIGAGFAEIENLFGGSGLDQFFFGPTGLLTGWLYGGAGGDWVADQSARANDWFLLGQDTGGVSFLGGGYFGVESIFGSAGDERFHFTSTANQAGWLFGGGGINWLNYAVVGFAIQVDLNGGVASLAGGVTQFRNAHGSFTGGNVLSGDAGDNILITTGSGNALFGWGGRDVLISGIGGNQLGGGDGEDLQIGGATVFDNDLFGLQAIMAEWSRTDIGYETRVINLRSGQGQALGRPLIIDLTVFIPVGLVAGPEFGRGGGAQLPTLFGGDGLDFFFTGFLNGIIDFDTANEFIN